MSSAHYEDDSKITQAFNLSNIPVAPASIGVVKVEKENEPLRKCGTCNTACICQL